MASPAPDPDAPSGPHRNFAGAGGWAVTLFGAGLSIWHIYANTIGIVPDLTRNTIHLAGFGALCALIFPLAGARRPGRRRALLAVDVGLAALTIACVVYILVRERALSGRSFTQGADFVVLSITMVIVIEFARRVAGLTVPILILIAVGYVMWWGRFVPGALNFTGLSYETIVQRSIYGEDGMFGTIASISSTYVFMFILFGAFLVRSGAGDFIIDVSRAAAGRITGGTGLVAVLSSGLTGTISGSAVANTAQTGVITIPLMIRTGFPPRFAAGVEAAASTGGQLMPPIMGAGAFVMANYTEIPYFHIVAVSILPAVLFFTGIAFNVRIMAKKVATGTDQGEIPALGRVLAEGGVAFFVPIAVLIGLLVIGYTPTYSAGFAIIALVCSSWLTKKRRMGPRAVLEALAIGARSMVLTAVLLIAVGLIVMAITTTGAGNQFSHMIIAWSGGELLLAIALVAIASLVLGMGLPVTAAYIVLAALSAPALNTLILEPHLVAAIREGGAPPALAMTMMLFTPDLLVAKAAEFAISLSETQAADLIAALTGGGALTAEQAARVVALSALPEIAGVVGNLRNELLSPAVLTTTLLSAHMIIFWLSQDSNVTPPVCLTAFTAAGIARTPPMATGVAAWKISKTLYIVPLLFAYTPLLSGDWLVALEISAFAIGGIYALIAAMEGHAEAPVGWLLRLPLAGLGVALLWPDERLLHLGAAALLAAFLVWNVQWGKPRRSQS